MIVTCDGCHTKYLLSDDKIPEKGIRVRCPKCRHVWRLMPPIDRSVFEISTGSFSDEAPVVEQQHGQWGASESSASVFAGRGPVAMEEEVVIGEEKPPVSAERRSEDPEARKKMERSKRLARVFVSDILVYNKEKRDKGLESGDLMTVLGPEIKKAWEAYKEKVGPGTAGSNEYFRDALNEILANGQKVF